MRFYRSKWFVTVYFIGFIKLASTYRFNPSIIPKRRKIHPGRLVFPGLNVLSFYLNPSESLSHSSNDRNADNLVLHVLALNVTPLESALPPALHIPFLNLLTDGTRSGDFMSTRITSTFDSDLAKPGLLSLEGWLNQMHDKVSVSSTVFVSYLHV